MKRFEELSTEFFDGSLDPRGSVELGRIIETDDEKLRTFTDMYRTHGALSVIHDEQAREMFASSVVTDIRKNEQAFVGSVIGDLKKVESTRRPAPSRRYRGTVRFRLKRSLSALRRGLLRAAAAGVIIAAGWLLFREHADRSAEESFVAHVRATTPNVVVYRGELGGAIAGAQTGLRPQDRIQTKKGEELEFVYHGEATIIAVREATTIDIGDASEGKRLFVADGRLDATVAPQPPGKRMVVTTPHAVCEVVGTRFIVTVDPASTRLDVLEGTVLFRRIGQDESLRVAAGQRALASAATLALAPLAPQAPEPEPALPAPVDGAITISCDNEYILYLNGKEIGRGANWQSAQTYEVTLPVGRNVIAVRGRDMGGVAALLTEIRYDAHRIGTDRKWKISLSAPQGWEKQDFSDTTWPRATEHALFGQGTWGSQVAGFPSDTPARWIWASNNEGTEEAYLRFTFDVEVKETTDGR